MWLYGPKAKFTSKKILFRGLTLWREPNYLKKKTVQINLGHMNINRYLPFCLVCVRTVKELPTYQHSQGYYCKDKSARSVIGYTVLAASYRMDWLDTCKTTGRMLLTKLPFGDGLTLPYVSYYEQTVEQMDPHPERVSDPVTEENIFQSSHLPSEHRRDCQRGHCWAAIVKQTIICRPTSSGTAKYLSYQAVTEQLLDKPNRQWFI